MAAPLLRESGGERRLALRVAVRASSTQITETCIRHAQRARFHGVTLQALCDVSGVSERRLRDAFYECFGVSPTVLLRVLALHAVRRALMDNPTTRGAVTRAAADFGFWHLSRFASQYRSVFGESPSETVARARAGRPGRSEIYEATAIRPDRTAATAAS